MENIEIVGLKAQVEFLKGRVGEVEAELAQAKQAVDLNWEASILYIKSTVDGDADVSASHSRLDIVIPLGKASDIIRKLKKWTSL